MTQTTPLLWSFEHLKFEFVSSSVLRYSNFSPPSTFEAAGPIALAKGGGYSQQPKQEDS
jgi:hypothetical protein